VCNEVNGVTNSDMIADRYEVRLATEGIQACPKDLDIIAYLNTLTPKVLDRIQVKSCRIYRNTENPTYHACVQGQRNASARWIVSSHFIRNPLLD
jgi:hypothetical protein